MRLRSPFLCSCSKESTLSYGFRLRLKNCRVSCLQLNRLTIDPSSNIEWGVFAEALERDRLVHAYLVGDWPGYEFDSSLERAGNLVALWLLRHNGKERPGYAGRPLSIAGAKLSIAWRPLQPWEISDMISDACCTIRDRDAIRTLKRLQKATIIKNSHLASAVVVSARRGRNQLLKYLLRHLVTRATNVKPGTVKEAFGLAAVGSHLSSARLLRKYCRVNVNAAFSQAACRASSQMLRQLRDWGASLATIRKGFGRMAQYTPAHRKKNAFIENARMVLKWCRFSAAPTNSAVAALVKKCIDRS